MEPFVSRIILLTHAHLDIERYSANPGHIEPGVKKLQEKVRFVIERIKADTARGGLAAIAFGIGSKFEDMFSMVKRQTASLYPVIESFPSIFLGDPLTIRSKTGIATTILGTQVPANNCLGVKKFVPPEIVWNVVKYIDEAAQKVAPNSYSILCGGRQFLSSLRARSVFKMASVYELDWQNRTVIKIPTRPRKVE